MNWILRVISIIMAYCLYSYKFIGNFKVIFSDLITFTITIFSFFTIFFTVLLGFQDSELFKKMKFYFEKPLKRPYKKIRSSLYLCIIIINYILFIKVFNFSNIYFLKLKNYFEKYINIDGLGVAILVMFYVELTYCILYVLNDIYKLLIKENEEKNIKKSE